MHKLIRLGLQGVVIALLAMAQVAQAQSVADYSQIIRSPIRTEQDLKIDPTRKPLEMLNFIQAQPGMVVLDIFSGGGYTAQLMRLAVGSSGKVWAFNTKPSQALADRLNMHPQSNFLPYVGNLNTLIPESNGQIDIVTIVNSYHDMVNAHPDIAMTNQRIYALVKPGGMLIIRDHEARAGSGKSATKTLHRIDPAAVIADFESVGFKKIAEGDFLKSPGGTLEESSNNVAVPIQGFILKFTK